MKPKLWLLTELFYPDQTSTGYIMTEIAESLAAGMPVHVICGPEGYAGNTADHKKALHPNISIARVNAGKADKNKVFSRVIRMIVLTASMAFMLLRKARKGDKVLMVTNPAPLLILITRICRWKKLKLVIVVHDVFPENMKAAGMITEKSPVYRILLFLFNSAYKAADLLIVLGRDMQQVLLKKTGLPAARIRVIENWSDIENIYPLARRVTGMLRLQFAGNFGRVQGLIPLLKAFCAADNQQIEMEFRGNGAMLEDMTKYVKDNGLTNVRILPPFNRTEQIRVLNDCDISIVSLAPGMAGLGVPSKAYNILAAGKPILFIGDTHSEIALLIRESNIGWVFPDFDQELSNFLQKLDAQEIRFEIREKGKRARLLAENRFAQAIILETYKKAIESV